MADKRKKKKRGSLDLASAINRAAVRAQEMMKTGEFQREVARGRRRRTKK